MLPSRVAVMAQQVVDLQRSFATFEAACAQATALAPVRLRALHARLRVLAGTVIQQCRLGLGQPVHLLVVRRCASLLAVWAAQTTRRDETDAVCLDLRARVGRLVHHATGIALLLRRSDIIYLFPERSALAHQIRTMQEQVANLGLRLRVRLLACLFSSPTLLPLSAEATDSCSTFLRRLCSRNTARPTTSA